MQAIQIKYLGATNTKGARIKAICHAKSRIYSRETLNDDNPGQDAAKRLVTEMGWAHGIWHGGTLKDGTDVYVCEPKHDMLKDAFSI
jgi:hypothetical protein